MKRLVACLLAVAGSLAAQDLSQLIREARQLNNQGKQTQAISLFRQALQSDPKSVEALLGLGIALDLNGQYEEARREIAKALQLATPQAKAQALKAMAISYAFDRNGKAAVKYERELYNSQLAAGDDDAAAETADELARILLESGELADAFAWYKTGHETALKKNDVLPGEKDLWDFRWEHAQARIAARQGQLAEAQKHVAAAKAILDKGTNPDQQRFFPYLTGYVAFYEGDYKTALADFQKGDQHDPFLLSLIGQTYEKIGNKSKAMEYYREVLGFNMHNPTNALARPLAKKKLS